MNRSEILAAATECVTQSRATTHGDAEQNFRLIATYWSAHLDHPVSPVDVPVMLNLLKVARVRSNPANLDNWIDGAGYLACGGEIATQSPENGFAGGLQLGAFQVLAHPDETIAPESTPDQCESESPAPAEPAADENPAPAPRKDAWTAEQDDKLIQMRRGGCSIEAMAKQVGRTQSVVLARLKKLRATLPGSCPFGREWTAKEDQQLIELRLADKKWDAIAKEIGRTKRSAQQRFTKLKKQAEVLEPEGQSATPSPVVKAKPPVPEPFPTEQASEPVTKAAPPKPAPATIRKPDSGMRVSDIGDLGKLKLRQRTLVMHLAQLSDDFEPIDDLAIAEGLMSGKKPSTIADELGCQAADIAARWKAMMTEDTVNHYGTPTLEGQQDILAAARHLVKCAEGDHG